MNKKEHFGLKKRFAGDFGEDYKLFEKAYPHFNELQDKVAEELLKESRGKKEYKVLEIGCGPGPTSLKILSTCKNAFLTAVDSEENMIKQAQHNLREYSERTEFFATDALSFLKKQKAESFDAFASGWTLHNFDDEYRLQVLGEIYRVIKKGGLFVNGDKYALDDMAARFKAFNWSIQQFLDIYPKNGRDDYCYNWIVHMGEDEKKGVIMPEKEALANMKKIGFRDIRVTWRKQMEAVITAKK